MCANVHLFSEIPAGCDDSEAAAVSEFNCTISAAKLIHRWTLFTVSFVSFFGN